MSDSLTVFGVIGVLIIAWFLVFADRDHPRDIGRPSSPYSTVLTK